MGVSESRLGCQPGLSGCLVWRRRSDWKLPRNSLQRRERRGETDEEREEEDARFLGKFHQRDLETGRPEAGGIGGFLSEVY